MVTLVGRCFGAPVRFAQDNRVGMLFASVVQERSVPHDGAFPSERDGNAQEGCGNEGGVFVGTFVLAVEQGFQIVLEIGGSAVLFGGFEGVHGWPEVVSEGGD